MICPQCGSSQSDELKFCKACGANLDAVRKALANPDSVDRFDWQKTWVADIMRSPHEQVKREAEIERLRGITPETKRRNEIKAGVITASVGAGVMVTVFFVMQGLILGGFVSQAVAELLSRVWVAGVIPLLVGLAIIVNGTFVAKRDEKPVSPNADESKLSSQPDFLPPADTTNDLGRIPFSVTDETTEHLKQPVYRENK